MAAMTDNEELARIFQRVMELNTRVVKSARLAALDEARKEIEKKIVRRMSVDNSQGDPPKGWSRNISDKAFERNIAYQDILAIIDKLKEKANV